METATQTLHRLTSYEPGREWDEPIDDPLIVQDLQANDLDHFPWFTKRYATSLPRVPLPRDLPLTTAPGLAVLAGTASVEPTDLDLPHLSRLLHLSAGVVRTTERPYATWLFRAAGSAGGRFPLELYVAVPDGTGLPPGVHWYDPQDHALVQVGPAPRGTAPTIVVTGIPWRTGWRYRERGFRHVYWDAGTMLAQLLAAADSAGHTASLHTRFPDEAVAELVGADGIHEWPVAVIALAEGSPAIEATGAAAGGDVDAAPREFPLVTRAQHAGDHDALGPPWERGAPVEVAMSPGRTRSTRSSSRAVRNDAWILPAGCRGTVLGTAMSVALRGIAIPHFVVVHHVGGIEPGVYRWPDLAAPVHPGAMREELFRVCLDQRLARDAAFVVIGAADVGALDDRAYREAQLAAGMVEGRLHLAAYGLGASATGMTFLDSEMPALLGAPLDALLFTCVGVPGYASTAGGPPGSPTAVRMMAPR